MGKFFWVNRSLEINGSLGLSGSVVINWSLGINGAILPSFIKVALFAYLRYVWV